jgi:phosphoesterase RecJ-like protein
LADGFADFLYRTPIINIDHRVENEFWGQLNLVNPKAAATAEVVHGWLENWNPNFIDEEVATALLAGLISETKSFRTSKVTPRTLEVSSQLARLGARRAEIVTQLWRTRELGVLKLWGRAVTRLVQELESGIVWTSLSETDFLETGTQVEDLEGVVEELIANVPNAKLTVLFHQRQGKVMAEVHATASYSAVDVARYFGGQGTRIKAEFELNQAYVEVIDKIKKIVSS